MLPASLLTLIASFILPLAAISSNPVCIPSTEGYQLDTLNDLYQSFCGDLSKEGFNLNQEVYGVPVISLSFVPTTGVDQCDQTNYLSTLGSLIQSCSMNKSSVWGTSSLDAGCGTFNFTLWNTTSNPVGAVATMVAVSATDTPALLNLASTQTSASMSIGKPTATKPSVSSTALGASDSAIIPVSGASLLGVALIFCLL